MNPTADITSDNTEGGAMTTITGEAEVLDHFEVALPANKRCDRCNAQAWVEVEMPSGMDLLFCSHDYNEHASKLKATAKRIFDYRALLTSRPENPTGT